MLKKPSYTKEMRNLARADGKGLITVDVMGPSKKGNGFGQRITAQSPASVEECKALAKFLLRRISRKRGGN